MVRSSGEIPQYHTAIARCTFATESTVLPPIKFAATPVVAQTSNCSTQLSCENASIIASMTRDSLSQLSLLNTYIDSRFCGSGLFYLSLIGFDVAVLDSIPRLQ